MTVRFQKQEFKHNPEAGTFGDCHRTCIACLLGIDRSEIPNWGVHYNDGPAFDKAAKDYLSSVGLRSITFPIYIESPALCMDWMKKNNPGTYYLLTGTSKNGTNHVVICRDDLLVWDPAIDDSGIVGACDNAGELGWYWIDVLIADSDAPVPAKPI